MVLKIFPADAVYGWCDAWDASELNRKILNRIAVLGFIETLIHNKCRHAV